MATLSMNIDAKVALITGSAKRIGRAIAVELARRGARVALHFRSSETAAQETLRDILDAGGDGALFRAELADDHAVERLFNDIQRTFGGLDILVNNASVFSAATADHTTPAAWDEQLDVNAKAPFFMSQLAARLMRARGHGKIINIADVAGEVIWPAYFPYSVSKAALIALSRGLAKAFAPQIQVNAIAPGPVFFPEYYTEKEKKSAIDRTLLKRAG